MFRHTDSGDYTVDGKHDVQQHYLSHRRSKSKGCVLTVKKVRSWIAVNPVVDFLRMAMKIRLSTPSTTSMAITARSATQALGSIASSSK